MNAHERFAEPREEDVLTIIPNKKELGKLFKKDAMTISDALEALPECERCWAVGAASDGVARGAALRRPCGQATHPVAAPCRRAPVAGDALEMQAKLAAGQSAPLQAGDQVFEMQPGYVEIKKERKRLTGRCVRVGPGVGAHAGVVLRSGAGGGSGGRRCRRALERLPPAPRPQELHAGRD